MMDLMAVRSCCQSLTSHLFWQLAARFRRLRSPSFGSEITPRGAPSLAVISHHQHRTLKASMARYSIGVNVKRFPSGGFCRQHQMSCSTLWQSYLTAYVVSQLAVGSFRLGQNSSGGVILPPALHLSGGVILPPVPHL
ncbi:hypothetical protein B0H14DRAFT_3141971 [Mycena olivaceomarginata]|nr:hypothetical protein B0H14DRAFT_3141971 [Mycena olivaceomarginata]